MKLFVVIPLLSQYIHFRPYAQAKSKQPRFSSISQSNLRGRVFSTISITRLCTEISTIQSFSFVTSEKSPCPGDKLFKISDSCTEILIQAISNSNKLEGEGFFSHILFAKIAKNPDGRTNERTHIPVLTVRTNVKSASRN